MPRQLIAQHSLVMATAILTLLFIAAMGLNVKIVADGFQSHAVSTRLKIARYKWYTGNLRGTVDTLVQAGATAARAGLRWQVAQVYFFLAHSQHLQGHLAQANLLCQAALEALSYGQYDHTRTGTSTTSSQCGFRQPDQ